MTKSKKAAFVAATMFALLGYFGVAAAHGQTTEKASETTVIPAQTSWWPYDEAEWWPYD